MRMSSIYNRAEIIDKNFYKFVASGQLPAARVEFHAQDSKLRPSDVIQILESQMASRALDLRARELKNHNLCFYTIGSSGHEGNAVCGKVFRTTDMAFLHYRSGAFMAERAKQLKGSTPTFDGMLSFLATTDEPIAGGRHKVFGSKPLMVPPQTSTIASHLPKAVGAAMSIGKNKDLGLVGDMPNDAVVMCSFGDASSNHATAQAAFNTASLASFQNLPVPLVFVCEDNGIGISVPTPEGWIYQNYHNRPGLSYFWGDGLNVLQLFESLMYAVNFARSTRKPVFMHISTVRLMAHAGSDPEWTYNSLEKIEATEFQDPLLHTARIILENGWLSSEEVIRCYDDTKSRVHHISNSAIELPKLSDPKVVASTITACAKPRPLVADPTATERAQAFGKDFEKLESTPLHMAKLINHGLTDVLLKYKNTLVFGEDVAQKGGVYNVTDGLFKKFGLKRVFNSPLDETSILGMAIGLAHNGFVPIPEIQFLAYVHNAEDQIRGEAATLAFFSQGQFTNPMVIRIAGLAYQKGFGGHFHNDNSIAIFRDIPGLIVAIPSNGADAVKMMRTCVRMAHEKGRVVVFIEPIALYMTKDLHQEGDKGWSFPYPALDQEIDIGDVGSFGDGKDCLLITYGNGYFYSRQAEKELREKLQIGLRVLDLRWISPLPWTQLEKEIRGYKKILIVEECRKTGSLSEGLVAGIVERFGGTKTIKVVAADDCFIPLGPAAAAGLPKKDEVIKAVLEFVK